MFTVLYSRSTPPNVIRRSGNRLNPQNHGFPVDVPFNPFWESLLLTRRTKTTHNLWQRSRVAWVSTSAGARRRRRAVTRKQRPFLETPFHDACCRSDGGFLNEVATWVTESHQSGSDPSQSHGKGKCRSLPNSCWSIHTPCPGSAWI